MSPQPFISAAVSHVGCVRSLNEDACLTAPERGLWAVADGMGGHDAGEVAAQAIVHALGEALPADMAINGALEERAEQVQATLSQVHQALREEAALQGGTIGSTVVVCLVAADRFACLWAGDSRCYHWRDGRLEQISHDHSYVQDLADLGVISAEEVRGHPRGNIITRAVGAGAEVTLDRRYGDCWPGDRLLMCSDGLNRMVEDAEIAEALAGGRAPQAVCDTLLQMALDRGAKDNVTVVVIDRG